MDSLAASLQKYALEPLAQLAPGLGLASSRTPRGITGMIYEPHVCLIVQGEKEIVAGSRTVTVAAGQCILLTHALPVVAQITHATADQPYLSLVAALDMGILGELDHQLDGPKALAPTYPSFDVVSVDEGVLGAFQRFVSVCQDAVDVQVLGATVRRELHYRLLRSDSADRFRALLQPHGHAANIAAAIRVLREEYRQPLQVPRLAQSVGMSPSSFYKHFKAVTSTTPLQYQKGLRLTEARHLLLAGEHSVATAAYAVGYESASQFSREYSRKFGAPPRQTCTPAQMPV